MSPVGRTAILGLLLALLGCEEPAQVGHGLGGASGTPQPEQGVGQALDAGTPDANAEPYDDEEFVESETNRDPFRDFAAMFKVRPLESPQREVKMPTTPIEQMRLIAIISGVAKPRAMLVDPTGVGYVVERGDFIGRAEVVQAAGADSTPLTLNWRVDRIRPDEVVLSREDGTSPGRPPINRVIPLHEGEPTR